MGNPAAAAAAASRGALPGTPVRLVSPAPLIVGGGQQGQYSQYLRRGHSMVL